MTSYYFIKNLPHCSEDELQAYLNENQTTYTKIEFVNTENKSAMAKVYFSTANNSNPNLDFIEEKLFKNEKLILSFTESDFIDSGYDKEINHLLFKKGEIIHDKRDYTKDAEVYFIKYQGDSSLVFTDNEAMDKQRAVLTHIIKSFGSNLLSGSGIMNITLPINIFDTRSLLDLFAHQHRQLNYFMSRCIKEKHPAAKIKWVTAFALAKIHMTMTQLKPFNPILGETFQAEIGESMIYLEQTSHHPPIYNFLILNKDFKVYGYEEPKASTGPNSVLAKTEGKYIIELKDGTKYSISSPQLYVDGTIIGDRTFTIKGNVYVEDNKNNYVSIVEFSPDDRGFFKKIFTSNNNFPDYFRVTITRINQCSKEESLIKDSCGIYTPLKNHTSILELTGCWFTSIECEGEILWERQKQKYDNLVRMSYTLASDSTLRKDLMALFTGDEGLAQKEKVRLEEIQRKDRRLRAEYLSRKNLKS